MKIKKEGKQQRTHITLVTTAQSLFLTIDFFIQNNLNNYAAACAYGFLFSFIPVVMMILVILIRILHASPTMITAFMNFGKRFSSLLNIQSVIDSILSIHHIGWVEIVLGLFIFWIARNFFFSIMQGIRRIFRTAVPARPILNQVIAFAGEVLLVISGSAIIFFIISIKTVMNFPIFEQLQIQSAVIFSTFSRILLATVPYGLIFVFVAIVLKVASGIYPEWRVCFTAAGLCTLLFWITVQFLGMFLNINRYNIVYGVLGNLIILLFEVYIFFILFLFCAQFIFVLNFFNDLLLGELYLLPKRDDTDLLSTLRRVLFIRPDYLLQKNVNTVHCKKGDIIFKTGDSGTEAYYVANGTVCVSRENRIKYYDRGAFFGELTCVINKPRDSNATAYTDADLVVIEGDKFYNLLKQNPQVSVKALGQISDYLSEVYGRREEYLL